MIYGYLVGFVIDKIEKRTSLYRKRIFEMIRERGERDDETLEEAALKVLEYFHIKLNDEEKKILEKSMISYLNSEKNKRRTVDYEDNNFYRYNLISRCWGVKKEPWRQFIFLGKDEKSNPCYLLLFAKHEYEKEMLISGNSVSDYNHFRESVLQKEHIDEEKMRSLLGQAFWLNSVNASRYASYIKEVIQLCIEQDFLSSNTKRKNQGESGQKLKEADKEEKANKDQEDIFNLLNLRKDDTFIKAKYVTLQDKKYPAEAIEEYKQMGKIPIRNDEFTIAFERWYNLKYKNKRLFDP